MADPSQSKDFPKGTVPVGDAHTHGLVVVEANVTSGGLLQVIKIQKQCQLTLNDFGNGPNQYQVINGANDPSGDDTQMTAHLTTKSSSFERSYIFTPSGLAYSGTLSKDGKSVNYQINYNLSKTNPS